MSMESAVKFYEMIEENVELQQRLSEMNGKEKIESFVKGELGYDFTEEEIQKVIFERHPGISDEELLEVAGGSGVEDGFRLMGSGFLKLCEGVGTVLISAAA